MQLSKSQVRTVMNIMTVVLLVLLFCSIILGYLMQTLRSDTFENYQSMSAFVKNSLDDQLQNIRRYSLFLELNTTSIDTAKHTQSYERVPDPIYKLSLDLLNYQSITPIVDDIYIYYPKSDLIVGNIGCFPSKSFFALYRNQHTDTYANWIEDISTAPLELSVLSFPQKQSLCYLRRIGDDQNPQGYIVFVLNIKNLFSSFSEQITPTIKNFKLSLLADGIPLIQENYRSSTENLLEGIDLANGKYEILNKNSLQIHVIPSSFSNLSYVNIYDLGDSYRSLRLLLILTLGGILLIGIAAFILSLSLSVATSKPLRELLLKMGASPDSVSDEYTTINNRLDLLLDEKSLRISKLEAQQDNIDSLFLLLLLSPSLTSEEQAFQIAKRNGIMMQNQYFYPIIFSSPQDIGQVNNDRFMSLLTELGYECWATPWKSFFVMVLHADEVLENQQLENLARTIREQVFVSVDTQALIALGSDSLLGIRDRFTAVLKEYPGNSRNAGSILFASEKNDNSTLLQSLELALKKNDGHAILVVIDSMFNGQKTISKTMGEPLAEVFNTYFRAQSIAHEIGTDEQGVYWKSRFLSVLSLCTKEVASPAKVFSQPSMAKQAKEIIDSEYTDYFLGLYKLAEKLSVSNSYLSTTFKETYGIGVVQYINQLRIKLAKEMLLSTNKSIKEIALEVGFSSDISFIRVFKRYERKTPGMLRK
ncbi:AraC family transcriptional regulator [uncultured Sphaerochaeta sp.]|uniref:helix-turn-helix domain-containing protein n=1 Tax=uncultured Sphaerochaeta sp. TaxID=886478 RepID=UPI002A0A67EB|nr:AraC family transcriptional regulator [uncultured Sphaerochaeta sp.]